MVDLLRDFHDEYEENFDIPFDGASAVKTIRHVMNNGVVLAGKKCCIGGVVTPWLWNKDHMIAHVVFWKAKSHSGMRIFDAFTKVVHSLFNARVMAAAQMPGRMLSFYSKRGLKAAEVHVIGPNHG